MTIRSLILRYLMRGALVALTAIAIHGPGYSQLSGTAPRAVQSPITLQEFTIQMVKPEIRENPERYIEEIKRRRIAFLPTQELKNTFTQTVSNELLSELNKNVATYFQVSEFHCIACPIGAGKGKAFAQQILDELKSLTSQRSVESGSNPLYHRAIASSLASPNDLDKLDTPHVILVVTGSLITENRKQKARVSLGYQNAGYLTSIFIKSNTWSIDNEAARTKAANQISNWVAVSLRSVITPSD